MAQILQYPVAGKTGGSFWDPNPYAPQQNVPQPQQGTASPPIMDVIKGADFFKSGGALNNSIFGGNTAGTIDQIGHSLFGIGNVAPLQGPVLPGTYGPAPAGVGIEGGLSNNFTPMNIGAGILGGFAANQIFGGGVGTNIGSTIGGAIGSFGGPIGTAVGSFLGGGLGSLFGGKKPSNKLQVGGVNFENGENDLVGAQKYSQQGDKYSQQNAMLRDTYASAASDTVKYLRSVGAVETAPTGSLILKFGDRSGYDFYFNSKPYNEGEDEQKQVQSYGKDLNGFTQGLSDAIIGRFDLTPEQAEEARRIFASKVQAAGGQGGGSSNLSAPMPMVAPRKSFPEFMSEFEKARIMNNASI